MTFLLTIAACSDVVQPVSLPILLLVHLPQILSAVVHFVIPVEAGLVMNTAAAP